MSQYCKLHNTAGCQCVDQCKVFKRREEWVLVKVIESQVLQRLWEPSEKKKKFKTLLVTLTPTSELECGSNKSDTYTDPFFCCIQSKNLNTAIPHMEFNCSNYFISCLMGCVPWPVSLRTKKRKKE